MARSNRSGIIRPLSFFTYRLRSYSKERGREQNHKVHRLLLLPPRDFREAGYVSIQKQFALRSLLQCAGQRTKRKPGERDRGTYARGSNRSVAGALGALVSILAAKLRGIRAS